jgi:hypothetical protein
MTALRLRNRAAERRLNAAPATRGQQTLGGNMQEEYTSSRAASLGAAGLTVSWRQKKAPRAIRGAFSRCCRTC